MGPATPQLEQTLTSEQKHEAEQDMWNRAQLDQQRERARDILDSAPPRAGNGGGIVPGHRELDIDPLTGQHHRSAWREASAPVTKGPRDRAAAIQDVHAGAVADARSDAAQMRK
jgi:hypothetical protein